MATSRKLRECSKERRCHAPAHSHSHGRLGFVEAGYRVWDRSSEGSERAGHGINSLNLAVDSDTLADTPESYKKRMTEVAAKHLGQVNDVAVEAGVSCNVMHAEHEHPYQAIIDAANERGCDLIVMASHGRRGISAILLGSETVKVLTHSKIPVLVCRGSRSGLFPPYFAAS